jgi:endonuclease/exonuclease/phosphatase family metal-dependent hydrolase
MHLTAGGTSDPDHPSANKVRESQVAECVAEHPDLVIGDLNAGPEASPDNYEYALSHGFACGYREAGGCDFHEDGHTWDPKNPLNIDGVHGHMPPERIDHVLRRSTCGPMVSSRARRTQIMFREPVVPLFKGEHAGKSVTISDHYGLLVDYV